ncbi:hypothetical protein Q3G72_001532 [Acer saccharum]|nr:hypothetical protein Q3G72_001532 [Acer saccharum]
MINQLLPGVHIASAAEAKISTACFNHCTPAVPGRSLRLLLQFIVISVNHTLPYHETGCVNSHFSFPSSFSHVSPENSYKQESSAAGWGRQDDAGVVKVPVDKVAMKSIEEREEDISRTTMMVVILLRARKDTLLMTS